MKKSKRLLSMILMCSLIMGILPGAALAASFPDVDDGASYADAVEYLKEMGIITGDGHGNFNPDSDITRAEMATILCQAKGAAASSVVSDRFRDVPSSHWANRYVAAGVEQGWFQGVDDGRFAPDDSITYEQAITMLINAAGWREDAIERGGYPSGFLSLAEEHEFLNGVSVRTGQAITRAEVAQIIYNADLHIIVLR